MVAGWIAAYLISPALPIICLRDARAIGTVECVGGVFVALIAQIGLVTVLGATDGDPLQIFVNLPLDLSLFLVVLCQYRAGQRAGIWSADAPKQWRLAGRFFGGFLAVALASGIAICHLLRQFEPEHSRIEKTRAEPVVPPSGP